MKYSNHYYNCRHNEKGLFMGFTLYVHKRFDRVFKKTRLTDSVLCYAAGDVITGVFEADLGGGVIKKRLALHQGKRGGARTVIFFRQGTNLVYYDGWVKNLSRKYAREIDQDQLDTYRDVARMFFRANSEVMSLLVRSGMVREVKCNEN